MFNKQPKNITNHYHNVFRSTTEIDYDKLAKAIVKAQQEAEQQKEIENQQEENNTETLSVCETIKLIGLVIANKVESNGTMTSGFLGGVMSFVFNVLAILSVVVMVLGGIMGVLVLKEVALTENSCMLNITIVVLTAAFVVIAATIAFIFRCIANEIAKEKDRNYVIAVFSAVVAFAALVVSVADTVEQLI